MSPAEVKDLYKTLGVSENASKDEIRKAFRKLAVKYHPDRTKGDKKAEERFKEINEAYQVLSNEEKRKQYDYMRNNPFGAAFGAGAGARGGAQSFRFDTGDLGDLFGGIGGLGDIFSFFGGRGRGKAGRQRPTPSRGSDIQTSITIPFETAARGGKYTLRLSKKGVCSNCGGTGAQPGSKQVTCPRCKGTGSVFVSQGAFGFSRTCPECMGTGTKISRPCTVCHGTGKAERPKTLTVKIPPGIKDGQRIRLSGEGEVGERGGPGGDLYIVVNVQKHPEFHRDGDIIYSDKEINLSTAVLGGKVRVQTLQGPVNLKIPPGTQPGTMFKLKGRGVKSKTGRMGNHYVKVHVRIPKKLSSRQKKRFESFASSLK